MKKSKGIVSLVLIAALLGLLGFTCWQGFGSSHTGSARNINLGETYPLVIVGEPILNEY